MSKKPRTSKPARTKAVTRKPKAERAPKQRAAARAARPKAVEEEEEIDYPPGTVMCRSCGKRPGRPTAILGQMTQAELCAQCTALRKERIRLNRAAARGLRSSRLF